MSEKVRSAKTKDIFHYVFLTISFLFVNLGGCSIHRILDDFRCHVKQITELVFVL